MGSNTNSNTTTNTNPLPPTLWGKKGEFVRPTTQFRNFISREPGAEFPPEANRYHLYVSYACPWGEYIALHADSESQIGIQSTDNSAALAHRTLIVRKLKGLESLISVTSVHWHMSLTESWRFVTPDEKLPMDDCTPDPLHSDLKRFKELYLRANPDYQGRFSVPVLWDKKRETIVSNESSEIIRMLYTEFDDLLPEDKRAVDLYPVELREKIDEANSWTYENINNGVYKCGFAKTQEAYHEAVTNLFNHLDEVESHLSADSSGPYYFGSKITEADIRLYVTMIRFDPVYVSLFKTNKGMIRYQYPQIHKWLRNLYWTVPAFKDTTSFEHIKNHYFVSLTILNPAGVVPEGPMPHVLPLDV